MGRRGSLRPGGGRASPPSLPWCCCSGDGAPTSRATGGGDVGVGDGCTTRLTGLTRAAAMAAAERGCHGDDDDDDADATQSPWSC